MYIMCMPVTCCQVTEASDRYGGLLQAAKRARQQASSLESLRDQMADLAEQQLELVGCALQGVDGADPELKIPELEEELLDKEEEFSELRDLHEAMLERSPRAKAQAIKAVHSAVRQKHLLAREQQRFRAEQLDAEARITAARVTETAINNIVMRDVMQEAASRNAAVSRLAADAAADIAATAIHKAQGLLGRSAALDADMSVMDGDSPHGMHTYVDTLAEMKKQGSQVRKCCVMIRLLSTSECCP